MTFVALVSGSELQNDEIIADCREQVPKSLNYDLSVHESQRFTLFDATFPSYPIEEYDFESAEVYVEGEVYNRSRSDFKNELKTVLLKNRSADKISEWLQSLDGEFVIYVDDWDRNEVVVVPDLLGQLPLFYSVSGEDRVIVGRNKWWAAKMAQSTAFDPLALAEFLSIGYALADRTFFNDVKRIPPGTICRIDPENNDLSLERHYTFNFSDENHSSKSLSENARTLASKFSAASKRRAASCEGENVVLLSGGLDSRSVVAGLEKSSSMYRAVTRDSSLDNRADIKYAEQIANSVGIDWQSISTSAPRGQDLQAHLEMSAGADPFSVAQVQPFYRKIQSSVPNGSILYTGDGGDKVLPDLSPPVSLASLDDLIDYILSTESKFDTEVVEAVTGIPESDIRDDLRAHLQSYPESTLRKKFLHYEVFQRAFSWLFEATDTNRNYLWTTTPFYALDFLQYAMGCPDHQKCRYQLYTAFLQELQPATTSIENATFGAPPDSWSHQVRVALYNWLERHPSILNKLRPTLRRLVGYGREEDVPQLVIDCIREQIQRDSKKPLDAERIEEVILSDRSSFSRNHIYHLFTLTSFIDHHAEDPVIERHTSEDF